jgi:hypothetical protein
MSLPSYSHDQPQLEPYLERWALRICLPATFVQCLLAHGLEPAIHFTTEKGQLVTIRGSDIADSRTWNTFLASMASEGKTYSLSQDGPALAQLYHDWLLTRHTPRYRGIISPSHRAWFKRVVTLAVVRFLTWHKYERYVRGEREALADPWVANQLHQLHLLREATRDLPRLVHHILDNPGREQQLIAQFCSVLDEQVKAHLLVLPQALPALPDGKSHPFLLLSAGKEGDDA